MWWGSLDNITRLKMKIKIMSCINDINKLYVVSDHLFLYGVLAFLHILLQSSCGSYHWRSRVWCWNWTRFHGCSSVWSSPPPAHMFVWLRLNLSEQGKHLLKHWRVTLMLKKRITTSGLWFEIIFIRRSLAGNFLILLCL